jgi:putative flippase GtrA
MANRVTQDGQVETSELGELGMMRGSTEPLPAMESAGDAPAGRTRSYHPTRIALVNRLLDVVDGVTGGKADWFQRLFTYLCVGGFAAVVNLVVFWLMYNRLLQSVQNEFVRNTASFLVATEISILANFIPNDRITFSHLPGHSRSWLARCTRFHMTAIFGTVLTFGIQSGLHYLVFKNQPTIAQAIAIIIVTAVNFLVHHFFTYAHTEPKAA